MIPQRPERMVNEGPAGSCVINGVQLGWTNCTPASFAMAINKATMGRLDTDDCAIRRMTGDSSGGTTINQCRTAVEKLGVPVEVHTGNAVVSPQYLALQMRAGRGTVWQGNAGALIGTKFRSTQGKVNHAVYVNEVRGGTDVIPKEALVYDPAADGRRAGWGTAAKGPAWWPWSLLLKFAAALQPASPTGGTGSTGSGEWKIGPGKVYSAVFPDTEPHFHSKHGGVKTKPFPDDVFGKGGTSPGTRTIRQGPGNQYAPIRVLAVGARFGAFQMVAGGTAGPADDWYGDHNGVYWISTNGVVGRGG